MKPRSSRGESETQRAWTRQRAEAMSKRAPLEVGNQGRGSRATEGQAGTEEKRGGRKGRIGEEKKKEEARGNTERRAGPPAAGGGGRERALAGPPPPGWGVREERAQTKQRSERGKIPSRLVFGATSVYAGGGCSEAAGQEKSGQAGPEGTRPGRRLPGQGRRQRRRGRRAAERGRGRPGVEMAHQEEAGRQERRSGSKTKAPVGKAGKGPGGGERASRRGRSGAGIEQAAAASQGKGRRSGVDPGGRRQTSGQPKPGETAGGAGAGNTAARPETGQRERRQANGGEGEGEPQSAKERGRGPAAGPGTHLR
ncbi:spidroin-1-like [Jatropha curcas]|uniref:spidroin-1-like n=1 Tax=Jatropha curcas TaxID=180498 RepID=UPI0018955036|nr:spidroin-1-like [Jatropha curcas]